MARLFLAAAVAVLASLSGFSAGRAETRVTPCGVERWAVKTLTDPAARRVNFTPAPTTVDALRALRVPRVSFSTPRIRGIETQVFRVRATLVEAKREFDRDIHLVIASPRTGRTMIVELPDPSCTAGAVHRASMISARTRFLAACGAIPFSSYRHLTGTAFMAGVGFVDFVHGQRGVAPNGIELHPVLGFRTASCG